MAEETGTVDESNFIRHISSRWLFFFFGNWQAMKNYFEFLPLQKEYKSSCQKKTDTKKSDLTSVRKNMNLLQKCIS